MEQLSPGSLIIIPLHRLMKKDIIFNYSTLLLIFYQLCALLGLTYISDQKKVNLFFFTIAHLNIKNYLEPSKVF